LLWPQRQTLRNELINMDLETTRNVVISNMPFRTGRMFLHGAKFYETEQYILTVYDLMAVPYIRYNEEGTIFTTKNKGFISQKTVGELIAVEAMGEKASGYADNAKRRAAMLSCDLRG